MLNRLSLAAALSLTLLLPTGSVHAAGDSGRDAAKAFAVEGLASFDKGNFEDALKSFEQAEKRFHAPPHLLYIARSQAKLGKLLEARDTYRKLMGETLAPDAPGAFKAAQADGRPELDALQTRIPKIELDSEGAPESEVHFMIDNQPIENPNELQPVNPGSRVVSAQAAGFETETKSVMVKERDLTKVLLSLRPEGQGGGDSGPGVDWRYPTIAFAVGGAGLIAGTITGVLALGKANDFKDKCPSQTNCNEKDRPLQDRSKLYGTISTVGFAVAGVGAAAGVVLIFFGPRKSASASMEGTSAAPAEEPTGLLLSPTSISYRAAF